MPHSDENTGHWEKLEEPQTDLKSQMCEPSSGGIDLQKRHTENIQELLEDTNVRLNKMEGEYMAQTQSTVSHFFPFFAIFRNYLLTLHVPMLP